MSNYEGPKPWLEKPPTACLGCDATIIGAWTFYAMSKEVREAKGLRAHRGRGLCTACFSRWLRNGTTKFVPPKRRPHAPIEPWACLRCQEMTGPVAAPGVRRQGVRGLCGPCTRLCRIDGTLIDYEPRTRHNADVVEEWLDLKLSGVHDIKEAAPRMGMTISALEKALERARQKGLSV